MRSMYWLGKFRLSFVFFLDSWTEEVSSKHGPRTYYVRDTPSNWKYEFKKTLRRQCVMRLWTYRPRASPVLRWIRSPHAARTQRKFCMHLTGYVVSVCSQIRTEAVLTMYGFLNLAHVSASRQHALASTTGCDRGLRRGRWYFFAYFFCKNEKSFNCHLNLKTIFRNIMKHNKPNSRTKHHYCTK